MRGRLLHKFVAEIAQLDTVATRLDPDQAGPLTSGTDDDFKETLVFTKDAKRESARKEKAVIFVPCQIEVGAFEELQQLLAGNSPDDKFVLTFHFRDLEAANLIDPVTGECVVRVNDRLVSIRDKCLHMVQMIRTPPGLYVTQVNPTFGMGERRDLLLVTFEEREQGAR